MGQLQVYSYTIAQTTDVLVIEVPLAHPRYPTRNSEHRGSLNFSPKSKEYVTLFNTVQIASEEAVKNGWKTIDTPCDFRLTRYCTNHIVRDAMNLGGCEANALTRGGAWTDDTLGAPVHLDLMIDPEGRDRIVIVIQRQYPRNQLPRASRPITIKRQRGKKSKNALDSKASPATVVRDRGIRGHDGEREYSAAETEKILTDYLSKK